MKSGESFVFTDDGGGLKLGDAFKGVIKSGIADVDTLFEVLADALKFPSYFGENWNALDECLSDFHWIAERRICLIHRDVPSIGMDELEIYVDVLAGAVDVWGERGGRELIVIFPTACERQVLSFLKP